VTHRGLETTSVRSANLINALIGQVTPCVQTVRFDGIVCIFYRFRFLACASYASPGLDTANFPPEHDQRRNAHETKHRRYRGGQAAAKSSYRNVAFWPGLASGHIQIRPFIRTWHGEEPCGGKQNFMWDHSPQSECGCGQQGRYEIESMAEASSIVASGPIFH
jgi:hypothetical protein